MLTDDDRATFKNYGVKLIGDPVKDLYAVFSKMVERGEWGEFLVYAFDTSDGSNPMSEFHDETGNIAGKFYDTEFTAWLSCYGCPDKIPERMRMAAKFIRERGK